MTLTREFPADWGSIDAASEMTSDTGPAPLAAGFTNSAARWCADTRFRDSARAARHDIHSLRRRFGTSFEQACHRNRRGTVPYTVL
jgi:hypothetical protein